MNRTMFNWTKREFTPEGNGVRSRAALREYRQCTGRWLSLYRGAKNGAEHTLRIPSTVTSELARISTIEAKLSLDGCNCSSVDDAMKTALFSLRKNTAIAAAVGGGAYRVRWNNGRIEVSFFDATAFYPLEYTRDGTITKCAFIWRITRDGDSFLRVEYHITEDNDCRIVNEFYRNPPPDYLPFIDGDAAARCTAGDTVIWKDTESVSVIKGVRHMFFAPFTMPSGLILQSDSGFPAGESVFASACELIIQADMQFSRLIWEYQGGELAVDASEDMFRRTKRGYELPVGKERLYRINALSATEGFDAIRTFAPDLRDKSYADGLDIILSKIEDLCGVSRGTLSTINYSDRTATEIKDSKQRLYCTVCDIQKQITLSMKSLLEAVWECARVNGITGGDIPLLSLSFNDSVIEDASDERVRDAQEYAQGLITKEEFRRKWGLENYEL